MRSDSVIANISAAAIFASVSLVAGNLGAYGEEKPVSAEGARVASAGTEKENEKKDSAGTSAADSALSAILARPLNSGATSRPQPPSRIRLLPPEEILKNRSHEIILDDQGAFVGRIFAITAEGLSPASGMQVKLLTHGGLASETQTDSTGRFSMSGLKKDVGGVVAVGPSGMVV